MFSKRVWFVFIVTFLAVLAVLTLVDCDSSPPTGSWLPPQELHDLSGIDFPVYCQWGPYSVPCPDLSADGLDDLGSLDDLGRRARPPAQPVDLGATD